MLCPVTMSFKEKTEEELAEWLEQGGVPETVSLAFKGKSRGVFRLSNYAYIDIL